MSKISMTGSGAIIVVIEALLRVFGIEVPEGSTLAAINASLEVLGYVLMVWGQVRRPDLKMGLVRK